MGVPTKGGPSEMNSPVHRMRRSLATWVITAVLGWALGAGTAALFVS